MLTGALLSLAATAPFGTAPCVTAAPASGAGDGARPLGRVVPAPSSVAPGGTASETITGSADIEYTAFPRLPVLST
ncbi:hypothetical protein ACFZAU_21660 [Streptomyces sp. NPDC008238]